MKIVDGDDSKIAREDEYSFGGASAGVLIIDHSFSLARHSLFGRKPLSEKKMHANRGEGEGGERMR